MKAKAAVMDAHGKKKGSLPTRPTTTLRPLAKKWQAKYGRDWNNPNPVNWKPDKNPAKQPTQFYDDCARDDPLEQGWKRTTCWKSSSAAMWMVPSYG